MDRRSVTVRAAGLVYQPFKEETRALAEQTRGFLAGSGVGTRVLAALELPEQDPHGLDLVITFGGDGTVLRAARWVAALQIPILPLRMGTVNFLGELAPEQLFERLDPYLAGEFWLDERAMLRTETEGVRALALNDVVVGRGATSRAVRLELRVDDAWLTHYVADGLVVASATGSTGYALAAGGPVLAPQLDDMVLQPIAPHLATLHSLVIAGTSTVRLAVHTPLPGVLTVDGHLDYPVEDGQQLQVSVAAERTVFARRGDRSDFYQNLGARLLR